MRRLPPLEVSDADRAVLEVRIASTDLPVRVVQRAHVVLLAADGMANCDIAAKVGMHWNRVAVWRRRYALEGLAGLDDEERSGRPPVYGLDDTLLLLRVVSSPPAGLSRWTVEAVAAQMRAHGVAISTSQAWRVCAMLDVKPWDADGWRSAEPVASWSRATDLRGLYLTAGASACVFALADEPLGGVLDSTEGRGAGDLSTSNAHHLGAPSPVDALGGTHLTRAARQARGARELLDRIEEERRGPRDPVAPGEVPTAGFARFVADLRTAAPGAATLLCSIDNPLVCRSDEVQEARLHGVELHVTSNRRAWLQRLDLLLTVVEHGMVARGEADGGPHLKRDVLAFVKERLARGHAMVWSGSEPAPDLAAAV